MCFFNLLLFCGTSPSFTIPFIVLAADPELRYIAADFTFSKLWTVKDTHPPQAYNGTRLLCLFDRVRLHFR